MSITVKDNVMPPLTSNFDPILHKPPKFDIYGKMVTMILNIKVNQKAAPGEDPKNILKDRDNIVNLWSKPKTEGAPQTRTQLLEKRKLNKIPDISL